tara:strand:+ start:558 stop:1166 length:609 start_codon:yes stop_codon:yes gene_type:complete
LPQDDNLLESTETRLDPLNWINKSIEVAANILLCIMVTLTCIDVVGRYFFAAPLLGAHEMITLSMGIMIFLGMPLVTATRAHLVVDITSNILSRRVKQIQQLIVNSIALATFVLFSYLLWFHGLGLAEDFVTTEDFEIELAPLAFLLAIMCILTIFVLLNHILTDLFSKSPSYSTLKSKENYAAKSFAKNEDKSKRPQRIWK